MQTVSGNYVAYMKPLNRVRLGKDSIPFCPAYEKLASDFAFEIRANVPPVVLYRRPEIKEEEDAKGTGSPRRVCLSLVPKEKWVWQDLFKLAEKDPLAASLVKSSLSSHSGIIALDAWLGNQDRHHVRNAIWAIWDGHEGEMLFIDFANSMDFGGNWADDGYKGFCPVAVPKLFEGCLSKNRVEEMAVRIAGLDSPLVTRIVDRIPDDFIPSDQRKCLIEQLLWRKEKLQSAFSQWYPGT